MRAEFIVERLRAVAHDGNFRPQRLRQYPPMSPRIPVLFITAASLALAQNPDVLTFKETKIGTPPLTLSAPLSHTAQAAPPQFRFYPAAPTDLIAPAAEREKIVRDVQRRLGDEALPSAQPTPRPKRPVIPVSAPDLIGSRESHDKLVRDFLARTSSENRPAAADAKASKPAAATSSAAAPR